MKKRTLVYLAIGSNIDAPEHIARALASLRALPGSEAYRESSWYRTRPWGVEDQPDFINLVVELSTTLTPPELLRETQAIEAVLHRRRQRKNGPRTIDVDILLFGEAILEGPDLTIPHPGLTLRDFMLIPLIEIAPDAWHPQREAPVKTLTGEIRYRQIIERMTADSDS